MNKEEKREYQRAYMKKKRSNKSLTNDEEMLDGNVRQDVTPELNYESPIDSLYNPRALARWMVSPRRERLGKILTSFGKREELLRITYICGVPLDEVSDLFEATQ